VSDWWVVLVLSFCGGFLGGTIAYWVEAYRWGVRLRPNNKKEHK
jgi:membrane protein YqaA with SNARE-associated domain